MLTRIQGPEQLCSGLCLGRVDLDTRCTKAQKG